MFVHWRVYGHVGDLSGCSHGAHLCEVSKVPDFHSAPLALRPGRLSGEAAVGKSGTAWKAMEEVEGICIRLPIGSMYGIYGDIYHQYTPNVSIYTIHGSYGLWTDLIDMNYYELVTRTYHASPCFPAACQVLRELFPTCRSQAGPSCDKRTEVERLKMVIL